MRHRQRQSSALTKKATAELERFLRQAQEGDEAALMLVRGWFDDCPSAWDKLGDLARTAEDSLINLTSNNPVLQEALRFKLNALRTELV